MTNPVPGYKVTYPYGAKSTRYAAGYHTGEDYFAPQGTPVVAAKVGIVEVVGYNSLWGAAYGRMVVIRVGEGETAKKCLYAHLSKTKRGLHVGQKVKTGQRIGRVGSTGTQSTGPHLHYEERTTPWLYSNKDRKPVFPTVVSKKSRRKSRLKDAISALMRKIRGLRAKVSRKRKIKQEL